MGLPPYKLLPSLETEYLNEEDFDTNKLLITSYQEDMAIAR